MSGDLDARILAQEGALRAYLTRRCGSLLRFEELDDLVQSVFVRALGRAGEPELESEPQLRAWLFTIAANLLEDRREHWRTLKRGAGRVVRLTLSERPRDGAAAPPALQSGPATKAARRELLVLTARALAALPEQDRHLVKWRSEGVPVEEQAVRLGLSYAAAQRAGLRAFERFRKVFELATRRAGR
ncbi:MAG: sigma factor [Planctomycetota bacterium]